MKQTQSIFKIAGALLGWIGAVGSLSLGVYIVSTCLALFRLLPRMEHFLWLAYTTGVVTALSSVMLVVGSYLIYQNGMRKGGKINLIAGIIVTFTYIYFMSIFQPSLLNWLSPLGYLLPAPALLSGAIGMLKESN